MKPYKRSDAPGSPYYVKFSVKCRQYVWSTKTDDIGLARKRAKDYRQKVVAGEYHLVDAMHQRSQTPAFSEIFKLYMELPLRPKEGTRRGNVAAMKWVLAASGHGEESRVDCLGGKLVITYKQKMLAENVRPVTINAHLRFARSIFSKAAMRGYRSMGKEVAREWVDAFLEEEYLDEPEVMPNPPTAEQMALAEKMLPAHLSEWKAYLLAKYGCCRAGEIKAAKVSWIVDSTLYIGGQGFVTKGRKWRAVALPPEVATILLGGTEGQEYLITEGRARVVDRSLPAMLRGFGFTNLKPVQSLNVWHVSWRATNQGVAQAQQARGHASPVTTMKHYGRVLGIAEAVPYGQAS